MSSLLSESLIPSTISEIAAARSEPFLTPTAIAVSPSSQVKPVELFTSGAKVSPLPSEQIEYAVGSSAT